MQSWLRAVYLYLQRAGVFPAPTRWAKNVIPLVQCIICTRGITFLAHPVEDVSTDLSMLNQYVHVGPKASLHTLQHSNLVICTSGKTVQNRRLAGIIHTAKCKTQSSKQHHVWNIGVTESKLVIYLIKAKGPEATYIAVQLHNTKKQYARLLTWATT